MTANLRIPPTTTTTTHTGACGSCTLSGLSDGIERCDEDSRVTGRYKSLRVAQ